MEIHLPLTRPPFVAYLFLHFPLSILARCRAYLPWFYQTHVQWFTHPGEDLRLYVHPLSLSHSLTDALRLGCPLLDVQSVSTAAFLGTVTNPAEALVEYLRQGYYVQLDLDHYHLPFHVEYRRRHYLHEALIHGHEAGTGFRSLAPDGAGRWGTQWLSAPVLLAAMSADASVYAAEAARMPGGPPYWYEQAMAGRPRLFLFRYDGRRPPRLDAWSLVEQLQDYVDSANSSRRHRLVTPAREGGAWGLAAYGGLADAIDAAAAVGRGFPVGPMRLLLEHKQVMGERWRYLEAAGWLPPAAALSQRWQPVTDLAAATRLAFLRWAARGRKPTACDTRSLLSRVSQAEEPLLRTALAFLGEAACRREAEPSDRAA